MTLAAYDPPGFMTDLDRLPGAREQWSRAVSGWFDECIASKQADLVGQPCQFLQPAREPNRRQRPGAGDRLERLLWDPLKSLGTGAGPADRRPGRAADVADRRARSLLRGRPVGGPVLPTAGRVLRVPDGPAQPERPRHADRPEQHPGQNRARSAVVFGQDAAQATLSTGSDFVIPTGGGYFFSPSVRALAEVLAR